MHQKNRLSRREWLAGAARGALALSVGAALPACRRDRREGAPSPGPERSAPARHRWKLGLDTYTVHRCLTAKDALHRRDLWGLLDELDSLGLEGLQIDPSHFPGEDETALDRLASIRAAKGIYIEFGMGGWDPQRLARRIELTAQFGGRAVRTFCGSETNTQQELKNYIGWATPALREAAVFAEKHGVDIAVENHGDFTSAQLVELLDGVGHPRVGACLDTGNSLFRREDPLACARALAPYALSMHLKDWMMRHEADGTPRWKEAVLGEGEVPVLEILKIVVEHRPDLYIALETPVMPSDDEAETIAREWRHLEACASAARTILAQV